MRKPVDIGDLTAMLANAATTPALTLGAAKPEPTNPPAPAAPRAPAIVNRPVPRRPKDAVPTVSVFLRVPKPLYDTYKKRAVARTKQSGEGVSVQLVILEKMEQGDLP